MKKRIHLNVLTASLAMAGGLTVHGQNLISNGGFESGFADWSRQDQLGSEGTFHLQTGTTSPVLGETVPAPPEGSNAAMTDAEGPGSHVLFQTFSLAAPVTSAMLGFDIYIGNRADDFRSPETLNFATPELNQQARVDILLASANPFSVDAGDILMNLFQTNPGDPLESGYTHLSFDLAGLLNANLNVPLMLRFAEADNVFLFNFGIDNVSLVTGTASVPESLPSAVTALTLAGLCWAGQRQVRTRTSAFASAKLH